MNGDKIVKLGTLTKTQKFTIPGNTLGEVVMQIITDAKPNYYCKAENNSFAGFFGIDTDVIHYVETSERQTAMSWWNFLGTRGKDKMMEKFKDLPNMAERKWDTLTGREIEDLYNAEKALPLAEQYAPVSQDRIHEVIQAGLDKMPDTTKDETEGTEGKEKEAGND